MASNNITSSGIVNIFQATSYPISITFSSPTLPQVQDEISSGLGYIPFVWYNAYQINSEDIQFLSLYDDGIAPCMKLNFVDSIGLMKDKAFPLDDTKISVFLNSRSDQLKPIFMQFKIRDFSNDNGIFSIDSTIDVDDLYIKKFESYSKMTSNDVLQKVCKDIGLGFNTNIVDTNDLMTWINAGDRSYDFIVDVIERAYISDKSFISGYIDFYYNYTFVDIEKELSRDITKELGIVSTGLEDILKISGTGSVSNLFLTNDSSVVGTNIYFDSYRILNNSTSISIDHGYMDIIKYYDIINKSLLSFNVDSLVQNPDTSIILKGSPQDQSFYEKNHNYLYTGIFDSDNVHINYNYANVQNDRNIYDIQKIGMEIELLSPNFNIYKFQKILVLLSSNTTTPSSAMINQRLSGSWLIIDIKYIFYNKSLKQIVTLVKRELELSDEELQNEPVSTTTNSIEYGRGTYDNPFNGVTSSSTSPGKTSSLYIYQYVSPGKSLIINGSPYKTNYPNLPIVSASNTYILISDASKAIKNLPFTDNIKRSIFALMWEEAAKDPTGKYWKGINNNYGGVQTDSGQWHSPNFNGQTAKQDSTGAFRMFATFDTFSSFAQFLGMRVQEKGFGDATNATQWAIVYISKWWSPVSDSLLSSFLNGSYIAPNSGPNGTPISGPAAIAAKSAIYNSAMNRYV